MSSGELKLFNRYDTNIEVNDPSLKGVICLELTGSSPHTATRLTAQPFGKTKVFIAERFICGFMKKGRNNGKKRLAMRALRDAFMIVNTLTGENPLQILVDAIANAGPREDCARVGKGGAMKRTSVDVSPLRRLNLAINLICKGIRTSAIKGTKTIAEYIADEIIAAAKNSPNSYSVKKKNEIERMAKSNR